MGKVCVVTGGGSGMGLAAAKFMPKDRIIVVSGRTESKLTKAVEELKEAGFEAYAKSCDTSKRESVKALGTVYVNQEFAKLMHKGSVIIDIASMSAYAMPELMLPKKAYPLAETDETLFIKKALKMTGMIKDEYQKKGLAYSVSKNFVTWYAAKCAFDFGPRGIRVASLSPGLIATDMGNLESEHGGSMLATSCEERMGTPEELGFAIATLTLRAWTYCATAARYAARRNLRSRGNKAFTYNKKRLRRAAFSNEQVWSIHRNNSHYMKLT